MRIDINHEASWNDQYESCNPPERSVTLPMGDLASTSPPTEKLGLGEVGVVGLVTSSLK